MEKLEPVKDKPKKPKKPYAPPTLTIFGTVQEMTKKVGTHGTADGGTFPHNKTGV